VLCVTGSSKRVAQGEPILKIVSPEDLEEAGGYTEKQEVRERSRKLEREVGR
jgi:hypothetical protein